MSLTQRIVKLNLYKIKTNGHIYSRSSNAEAISDKYDLYTSEYRS